MTARVPVVNPVEKLIRLKAVCERVLRDSFGMKTAALEMLEDTLDELFTAAPSVATLGHPDD